MPAACRPKEVVAVHRVDVPVESRTLFKLPVAPVESLRGPETDSWVMVVVAKVEVPLNQAKPETVKLVLEALVTKRLVVEAVVA